MESNNNFEKLHKEHHDWMQEITGWHNELVYYNRVLLRLLEGAKAEEDTEMMEEFKSKFDDLEEHFQHTRKAIISHEKHLTGSDDDVYSDAHGRMRADMHEFKHKFLQLKNDFYVFEEKFIYE